MGRVGVGPRVGQGSLSSPPGADWSRAAGRLLIGRERRGAAWERSSESEAEGQ
jgi:hypothetical protein